MKTTALGLVALLAVACGGHDDPLDPGSVMNLPPGDAHGTAASGMWHFEAYTSACAGACVGQDSGFTISFCDVGNRDDGDATVTQKDGDLRIDVDESFYVSRFDGGLDADGAFDIGGYGTEQGGELEITARVTGMLAGDELSGTADYRIVGGSIDCRATYDLDGTR